MLAFFVVASGLGVAEADGGQHYVAEVPVGPGAAVRRARRRCAAGSGAADVQHLARVFLGPRAGRARRRRRAQREPQLSHLRRQRDERRDGGRRMARADRRLSRGRRGRRVHASNYPDGLHEFRRYRRERDRAAAAAAHAADRLHVPRAAARPAFRLPAVHRRRPGRRQLALQRVGRLRRFQRPEHLPELVRRVGHAHRPGRARRDPLRRRHGQRGL